MTKFRLKLKKVGKTTRPFRYDLNQIPYDYTVEVSNRFKGLDLTISRWGFLCGSDGKASACNAGDLGLTPGLGRYPGEGNGYPLQYPGLENSMNYTVHGVAKSQTQLSDFRFQVVAEQSEQKCPPIPSHSL